MIWLEHIRLRAGAATVPEVLKIMASLNVEIRKNTRLYDWHLFHHASISGDFSILLYWDTASADPKGSALALTLVNTLSSLGIVDHAIWIERPDLYPGEKA